MILPPNSNSSSSTSISAVHTDILETQILTRLDGPTLASASCASTTFRSISSQHRLWSDICQATWPSITSPRVQQIISKIGPRSFFAQSYSLPNQNLSATELRSSPPPPTAELISAVDIHYKDKLIFTKVEHTETVTGWFRCSPFRIDLLDPKDVVPTQIQHPDGDDKCTDLINDMRLSWIIIDPTRQLCVNLSSQRPVSVQRHWLSGEVKVRFATILAGDRGGGQVQCGIVVTCGGSEGGEMQVREVSMEVEDMDGAHLNGRDSLVILQRAIEGKKGKGRYREEEEGRKRYMEYLDVQRERRERKLRNEGTLDMLCVSFGVSFLALVCCFFFFR